MARRGMNTDDSSSDVSFRQRAHQIGHCTSLVCPIPTDPATVSVSMTFDLQRERGRSGLPSANPRMLQPV
ncbi:hypothetical protein HanPI659440_Chr06g0225491 [Helianthus annuus]|nr:hypothetical protein HanPI659440_Chr06g0225491 [Helianthus annuus]